MKGPASNVERQKSKNAQPSDRVKGTDNRLKAMEKKKVLLVDDSVAMRNSVRPLFDSHPSFEVCGEAEHGREAVEKAPKLRPDLIILDLSMPVMNGLEAAPLLIKILPRVWQILFTSHTLLEVERLSRAAGMHAVVLKHKASTHLIAQAEALFAQSASLRKEAS